jgi:Na+-translocating ferredoxin:NAD+ oxidoreductase subunit B
MLISVMVFGVLALLAGGLLGWAARRFEVKSDPIVDQINALLPQTQCAQCGFPGCRPYAEAIAAGQADINQCPPGGEAGVRALAQLLGREPKALNPEHGENKAPQVALIDESQCIGCVLCIKACPVDAIVGAAKRMHTVIEEDCTGCELCIAPCPVDCIQMVPARPLLAPGVPLKMPARSIPLVVRSLSAD